MNKKIPPIEQWQMKRLTIAVEQMLVLEHAALVDEALLVCGNLRLLHEQALECQYGGTQVYLHGELVAIGATHVHYSVAAAIAIVGGFAGSFRPRSRTLRLTPHAHRLITLYLCSITSMHDQSDKGVLQSLAAVNLVSAGGRQPDLGVDPGKNREGVSNWVSDLSEDGSRGGMWRKERSQFDVVPTE